LLKRKTPANFEGTISNNSNRAMPSRYQCAYLSIYFLLVASVI
jgi:hypothetical protein